MTWGAVLFLDTPVATAEHLAHAPDHGRAALAGQRVPMAAASVMTTKPAQQSVEMILVRQLASYLFVPVLVVDTTGTFIFYNEPAERILGVRFDEPGGIDSGEGRGH